MAQARRSQVPVANRIFVDRETPQNVFERAAFAIPPDRSILRVFYGVGGQGKTALCRELMRKTDGATDPSFAFLRRAELDLHGRTKEDPDRLLVWIRNGFADAGVAFPCFDLAFAIAWDASRGEEPLPSFSKPWLKRTTQVGQAGIEGAADLAKEVASELVGAVPGIGFALRRLGNWSIERGKRAWLERTKEPLRALYDGEALRKPHQLSQLLPWMLAQDLNAHLADHPDQRFVLFVDEYERVADEGGAGARWQDNPFDAHMRSLVSETNGMLAVFFSREKLPWDRDPDWREELADNQHLLGGLAVEDADRFLRAVPINDAALRAALIEGARETTARDAPVYPLMLDLQVEHYSALTQRGVDLRPEFFSVDAESFEGRRLEIVQRLLRDYGAPLQLTLEKLSVARRFDRQAFEHVIKTFGTGLPLDQFDRIADMSFVSRLDDGYLSIHNLVAETIREALDDDARGRASEAMLAHFVQRSRTSGPADVTRAHVLAFYEAASIRLSAGVAGYIDWLQESSPHIERSRLQYDLLELWREAADVTERQLGRGHIDTLTALNAYAIMMKQTGDFPRARPLYTRLLDICDAERGPDHADTAIVRNNFAVFLRETGDYAGAIALFENALAVTLKAFGEEHPKTATMINNLAEILDRLGDYDRARPLFEQALAIRERVLPADDPDIAASLNCLASLHRHAGRPDAARANFERALSIREKSLGPNHPETGTTLNDMALLLHDLGEFDAARANYERSLAISESTQGPDHTDVAATLNNLGALLLDTGNHAAARPFFDRALAIWLKRTAPDHPNIHKCRRNIALVLIAEGRFDEALALAEPALAAHDAKLGPSHFITRETAKAVARALEGLGRTADSAEVRRKYEIPLQAA